MAYTIQSQHTGDRGRQNSVSSGLTSTTQQAPGFPDLYNKTLQKKKKVIVKTKINLASSSQLFSLASKLSD